MIIASLRLLNSSHSGRATQISPRPVGRLPTGVRAERPLTAGRAFDRIAALATSDRQGLQALVPLDGALRRRPLLRRSLERDSAFPRAEPRRGVGDERRAAFAAPVEPGHRVEADRHVRPGGLSLGGQRVVDPVERAVVERHARRRPTGNPRIKCGDGKPRPGDIEAAVPPFDGAAGHRFEWRDHRRVTAIGPICRLCRLA